MHPKFVSYLCCPETGDELHLIVNDNFENGMVRSGKLNTTDGKRSYPVIDGVPRFVSKEFYSSSFGYEWKKWPRIQFESENNGRPMQGHTTRMFGSITHFNQELIKGKKVLEYGCGPGRFLDIVRKWGGIAVGIDLSLAVESARENFQNDEDVLIVQGDIFNPPFKKEIFDAGYSIGVLHHTPAPDQGIKKLCELVKQSGLIACSVYSKGGFYDYPSVYVYRKCIAVVRALCGEKAGNSIAFLYSLFASHGLYYIFGALKKIPIAGPRSVYILEKYLLVNLNLPDARWRLLDVFDAITPHYASTHTQEQVKGWLEDGLCNDIKRTDWGPTSFKAKRGNL